MPLISEELLIQIFSDDFNKNQHKSKKYVKTKMGLNALQINLQNWTNVLSVASSNLIKFRFNHGQLLETSSLQYTFGCLSMSK